MTISRARRSGITVSTSPLKSRSLQSATGLPGPVTGITVTGTSPTTASVSWTAPAVVGDSAITSYTVTGGGTPSVTGTTATVTGLSASTSYTFTVVANNAVGAGVRNSGTGSTLAFNNATGGTITSVSNYLGTGQTWRVHDFTSSPATLTVSTASEQFKTVVGGGGGGGGGEGSYYARGGPGGAGVASEQNLTIPTGAQAITVGGGGGGAGPGGSGGPGGPSSIAALISRSGGGGGNGGNQGGATGSPNGPQVSSNIAGGSPVTYGGSGGGGWTDPSFTAYPGGAGRVVVAYRIA